MRLDELQLAGQLPSPIQRAVPAVAQPSAAPQVGASGSVDENSLKNSLEELVQTTDEFPADSPVHSYVNKFLSTILSFIPELSIREGSKTYPSNLADANRTLVMEIVQYLHQLSPEAQNIIFKKTKDATATVEDWEKVSAEVLKIKQVQRAFERQNITIQLDTKGNIAAMDADIEQTARQFAKEFKLPLKWARNLIGMFEVNITREERKEFLAACRDGSALDVNKMIQDGEGKVEDYVLLTKPELKEVYNSVKDTLLDISLSTGQRGATGPFEAMMAIMGGCKKPDPNEGGDLKTKDGLKLEVKATSIGAVADSATSGKASTAWLDSTAGKEISGSTLRSVANEWIRNMAPEAMTDREFQNVWKTADFRPTGLESLKKSLILLRDLAVKPAPGKKVISAMMSQMFPHITNLQKEGYDFDAAVTRILNAIGKGQTDVIAREQGVMALLEYITGKDNDGFVFFNSSTQKFKIVMGVQGVINELGATDSNLHFDSTMTMGKSAKASPGVYYGAKPNSPEGQEYLKKFNSSTERVAMLKQIQLEKEAAKHNKNLALIQAAKEGLTEFEFDGKMFKVPKTALKKYFEPEITPKKKNVKKR